MHRVLAAVLAFSTLSTPVLAAGHGHAVSTAQAEVSAASAGVPTPIATQPGNGWIRVAPNQRYLQHANGVPFFVVGHDEAFGFFYQKMNPKPVLEAFLKHMKANGQNTLLVQVDTEETRDLAVMAQISRHVDWNDFKSHIADTEFTTDDKGIWAIGCSDDNQICGWLVKNHRETKAPTVKSRVRCSGLKPGAYEALWFDDKTGKLLRRDVARGMAFELTSPTFAKSLAVVVRPTR